MKRRGVIIVLLLAFFLISMPVIATDLESVNSFSQEISEITTIISKGELAERNNLFSAEIVGDIKVEICEIELFSRPFISLFIEDGFNNGNVSAVSEADDPKKYIYKPYKRRCDHPAFKGIA